MSTTTRRLTVAALAVAAAIVPVAVAQAGTTWMDPGAVYDSWNAAQYDPCFTAGSQDLPITSIEDDLWTGDTMPSGALRPAACANFTPMTITNTLDTAVRVTYQGASDDGTIADYVFEWITGWTDVVLQPGESTAPFTLSVGMPADVPNEGARTTGSFRFDWLVEPVEAPISAPDDSRTVTVGEQPDPFGVLVAGGAPAGSVVTVAGDPAVWSVVDGQVVAKVAEGFVGTLTTQYTITTPGGQSATGTLTVVVVPPPVGSLDDLSVTTPYQTAVGVPLAAGWVHTVSGTDHGAQVSVVDGVLQYVPAPGFTGEDVVRMVGTDAYGRAVEYVVHVTVGEAPTPTPTPTPTVDPTPTPTPAVAELPRTGTNAAVPMGVAAALLAIGAALVVTASVARRRAHRR